MKLILGLSALLLLGCSTRTPLKPPPPRISDSYAKAALKALDTIAANTTQARITDALFSADAEATSGEETVLTKRLYLLYEQEQNSAAVRRLLQTVKDDKYQDTYDQPFRRNFQRGRRYLETKVLEIDRREGSCYKTFADVLRNRSGSAPKECDSIEVEINPACYKVFGGPREAPPPRECDLP